MASTFTSPATDMFDRLGQTINAYTSEACRIPPGLWRERREDPALLSQSPRQWKEPTGIVLPVPEFQGFLDLTAQRHPVTSQDVGEEAATRLKAAEIAMPDVADIRPDPRVWN